MTAPAQQVPDSALVERIMAADEAALAALYDRYAGMLYAMLVRILKDTSAAEEVLQDLFLQLWRGAARFDASRGSLPGWLLVIGRNRALSRLRGKDRREIQDDPEGFSIEAVPSPGNLENEAARAQLMEKLRGAMASLPSEQREAVELAYFEGMTQTEIAERTGSPLGTVKSRVRAAMQTLKQVFEDESTRQSRRL
ncbi:MAG TPA: sigma-70 family RNA polymerase sigma factor [Acidobacteriaceae bacterium]|jgi:RNA polymerase sigma-70 factor (ECF subfamily)|nr:sigma-70 family RNA polymerase sigma factor [Acidobacteriaceae bacterium]